MFYDRLLKICSEHRTTPTTIVKALGLSTGLPTAWKRGTIPKADTVRKIADYLGVSVDALIGNESEENPIPRSAVRQTYGRVKVVSQVAAGLPIEAIDVFDPDDPDDWEELETSLLKDGEYFGLKVRGKSMLPDFRDGDIVIVRKQEIVDEGQIAVVTVNGESGTVKKIHFRSDGITLISLNPDFPPIKYSAEECRTLPVKIAGRVIRLHRDY